jgi:hypothetical protein
VRVVAAGRRSGLPAERLAGNRDCRRVVNEELGACTALAESAVLIRLIPRCPALDQSQNERSREYNEIGYISKNREYNFVGTISRGAGFGPVAARLPPIMQRV